MVFNSFEFDLFFPIVTIGYFALPHRFRWIWLLLASCVFYMAFIPRYILILFAVIAVDYSAGRLIERSSGQQRKVWLVLSLIANISILAFFKYFNFMADNVAALATFIRGGPPPDLRLEIILPIGLSFHTFQSMSYTIEVYRGKQKAEQHLGIFALYVLFYPQLVAGPIERPQNVLWQFRQEHKFDYQRVTDGLKLMTWGMFKKVVIADRLAVWVNDIYGWPYNYWGLPLILATVAFAYQIYCDFSGYSDIALGSAQVMGFKLMRNFRQPYYAKSISDFWSRWHISLSTWFRDYLFIPLRGRSNSRWRWQFNLFLVFLISGLWHGANWTYIIWGSLHGLYQVIDIWTRNLRMRVYEFTKLDRVPYLLDGLRILGTFTLVCFAWIFFRASSIKDAMWVVTHLVPGIRTWLTTGSTAVFSAQSYYPFPGSTYDHIVVVFAIIILEIGHFLQRRESARIVLMRWPLVVRWAIYFALLFVILAFGKFDEGPQFVYFQF